MRRDANKLIHDIANALRARGETVGFAESCSGGLMSGTMAAVPGVSDVFMGGVVAYSNEVKMNLLQVPFTQIRSMGAVSLPVARSMANGARAALGVDWAVSVTGIAGPSGGTPTKPVGTVCFGIRGPGVDKVIQEHFAGGRQVIQKASAEHALRLLLDELGDFEAEA